MAQPNLVMHTEPVTRGYQQNVVPLITTAGGCTSNIRLPAKLTHVALWSAYLCRPEAGR
jgi:hypothetical protein